MTDSIPPGLEGSIVADRYRVERLIGKGGMGTVWAGRHLSLKQLVAIKFIHPRLACSSEALRRFDTEAKAAARIKTRHAVTVHDHGVTAEGNAYIVMEYLEGETLEHAIRRRGRLPPQEVIALVSQAAAALDAAHGAGIVHRDLKPENVFLARDREALELGYTVKLVDFGIAKMLHDEASVGAALTQAGTVLGTPHYMSPEALTASAPISPASDLWSLGACAFAATCGRVPFEGEAIGDVVLKVCAAPLPIPSQILPSPWPGFDEWFARACHRDPQRRFHSAREMATALNELEQWVGAQREQVAFELRARAGDLIDLDIPEPRNRGPLIAGVLVGIAVTLGALGYYVVGRVQEANEAVVRTAASADAIVQAENERKLQEAAKYVFGTGGEPASAVPVGPGHSAPEPATSAEKTPRRPAPHRGPPETQ